MTPSQEQEFDVLGCKVTYRPERHDSHNAKVVIDLILREIEELRMKRPKLRDTDVAVLVALKIATEKLQLEDEYKANILKLEESLQTTLQTLGSEAV